MKINKTMRSLSLGLIALSLSFSPSQLLAFGLPSIGGGGGAKKSFSSPTSSLGGGKVKAIAEVAKIIKELNEKFSSREIGPMDEYYLGMMVAQEVVENNELLPSDHAAVTYTDKLVRTIAANSLVPRPYKGYIVMVVKSDKADAFALPGGFIFVTKGMFDFCKNEDELAGVIAHEITHVEEQHILNDVGANKVGSMVAMSLELANNKLLDKLIKDRLAEANIPEDMHKMVVDRVTSKLKEQLNNLVMEVYKRIYQRFRQGYSIKDERSADFRGMELARASGYSNDSFVELLPRVKEEKGSYGGDGYSKHRYAEAKGKFDALGAEEVQGLEARKERYEAIVKLLNEG